MVSKKDRRESGRVYVNISDDPEVPHIQVYWNEWHYHKDGMRMLRRRFKSWKLKSKKEHQWL